MKRYGNLYEKIYDLDNLRVAYELAKKGKSRYKQVKEFEPIAEEKLLELHNILKNQQYKNSEYKIFTITERGKTRKIYSLPFYPDRIVHHAIVLVLSPIWVKSLIRDTYASIPGRGIHDGVERVKKAIRGKENIYCLKLDIEKFYPSVDHDVLKIILKAKIKDQKVLKLLNIIIDSAPGIPIGNYLSQYFGNLVLNPLDHYVKENLKIKYYFRYCDDFILIHERKAYLKYCKDKIENFLKQINLKLKPNWQIYSVLKEGIDFIGYKFFPTHTLVRKKNIKRFKTRVNIKKININKVIDVINHTGSFKGWLKYADTKNFKRTNILKINKRILKYKTNLMKKINL